MVRRDDGRARLLGRRHAGGRLFLRRAEGARAIQCRAARAAGAADRSHRFRHRRVGRRGAGGLFRAQAPRRARGFPRALPDPQRRGGAQHGRQPRQHLARGGRRRQRGHAFPQLARRQPVRGRDVLGAVDRAAAAHLDQRHRHLQRHAVRVRQDGVQRDLQRPRQLPDRERGRSVGGRAAGVLADRARGLSGPLQSAAPGVDREGAPRPERVAAAARLRAGHRALPRRNGEVHQAARRRPGRQFRTFGLHHRAGVLRGALWPAHPGAGREDPPRACS